MINNGQPLGTTTVDSAGNWTFTPDTPLTNGPHEITTTQTDPAGNTSDPSDPLNFTVDTSTPNVQITNFIDNTTPIEGNIAIAVYRILQESLNNVVKHSGATSVRVIFNNDTDNISIIIADDGCGISADDLVRAMQNNRIGLFGMRERVELLFGRFEQNASVEGGAELVITIPHQIRERRPLFGTEDHDFIGG